MYKFKEKSRVCFFGDSITRNGLYIRSIYEYYIEKLKIPCEFYNCGVSGNHTSHGIMRLEETVLKYNPTDVVIFFGMNDVEYELYDGRPVTDDVVIKRRFASDEALAHLKIIANRLHDNNINLIFCTPTPYDDISDKDAPCHFGTSAALKEFGERVKLLADNYGGNVVDFFDVFYDAMRENFRNGCSLHNEDRVHPNNEGQELMAQIFLRAQGFDVELTKDYHTLNKIATRSHSEWENTRYELEQFSQSADYVIYGVCCGVSDHERRRNMAYNLLNDDNPYIVGCAKKFLEQYDDLMAAKEKLEEHIKTVYERL